MIRLIRKKEAAERVGWHPVHLMRMAKAGKFPAAVQIGPNSIAFVEEEVNQWILDKMDERDAQRGAPPAAKPAEA